MSVSNKFLHNIMQRQRSSFPQFVHKTGHNCRKNHLESLSFVTPVLGGTHIEDRTSPRISPRMSSKYGSRPENAAIQVKRSPFLSSGYVSPRRNLLKLVSPPRSPVRKSEHNSTQTSFANTEKAVNATEKMVCSATQTSKTIISMPILLNTGQMSPDSLSPGRDIPELHAVSSNYTLDGSVTEEERYIPFTRRNCVINYVHRSKKQGFQMIPSDNSLTHTFLEKNRLKSEICEEPTRSQFLEQTSPLLRLMNANKLKSQSFVDSPKKHSRNNQMRFYVKNVRDKPDMPNHVKPVRYFCQREMSFDSDHQKEFVSINSKNFMSPTISSEKKNQSKDIENISKLISPTRRGRSASPKHRNKRNPEAPHVPYIDKSSTLVVDVEPSTGEGDNYHIDLKSSVSTTGMQSVTSTASTEGVLYQAVGKLRDTDWNVSLRGLAEVVEVCRISDANFIYPHMTCINQRIIELLKSPRSHVCRTTCQAVGHLFEYVKDTRRPEFDEIVDTLLTRTADSNKFIRHDANLALDCMVTHIPTFHAIRGLCVKGPEHKNPLVRIATARLMVCAVVISGAQSVLHPNSNNYTRRRVIVNMVRFLNDKSSQTRQYGERLYKLLSKDRVFDIYLKKYLEKDVIVHLKKVMKNAYPRTDH